MKKFIEEFKSFALRGNVMDMDEAFFSVAKDEKKFIVGTLNNSKIVVHGTEFNVEAYKGKIGRAHV